MNKTLLMLLITATLSLAAYTNVDAQVTNSALLTMQSIGSDRAAVKAARDFYKRNGNDKDEKWYKLAGGYLAEYAVGASQHKVVFDCRGGWVYTMREYGEKELPKEVRDLVKSVYYDYSIKWVKEVTQYQSTVYVVHIDNTPEWKDLLVQDGQIEVQHEVVLR